MNEYILQITSGRGPEECQRVVSRVVERLLKEARTHDIEALVTEKLPGDLKGTLLSALLLLKGDKAEDFVKRWEGTVLWISPSPYRKFHKRKNWYVGVQTFQAADLFQWNERDVVYESLRASGPGGQHVNKTESAVRARHVPSGISVVASERRSQHQNKAEATERLKEKMKEWYLKMAADKARDQWQQHNTLQRGNPVRIFNERLS